MSPDQGRSTLDKITSTTADDPTIPPLMPTVHPAAERPALTLLLRRFADRDAVLSTEHSRLCALAAARGEGW
jgi:hypothetical protein